MTLKRKNGDLDAAGTIERYHGVRRWSGGAVCLIPYFCVEVARSEVGWLRGGRSEVVLAIGACYCGRVRVVPASAGGVGVVCGLERARSGCSDADTVLANLPLCSDGGTSWATNDRG